MLKGLGSRQWLYPGEMRPTFDSDLMVGRRPGVRGRCTRAASVCEGSPAMVSSGEKPPDCDGEPFVNNSCCKCKDGACITTVGVIRETGPARRVRRRLDERTARVELGNILARLGGFRPHGNHAPGRAPCPAAQRMPSVSGRSRIRTWDLFLIRSLLRTSWNRLIWRGFTGDGGL